jgi:N-acetylmuramoyl-L-alanine amidase
MKICIDPGHGGSDKGGRSTGIAESLLALDYARELNKVLQNLGVTTIMTRSADRYVELGERADIANRAGADIFVSIHGNASTNPKATGPWTIYSKGSVKGAAIAKRVQEALVDVLGGYRTAVHTDASPSVGYTVKANEVIAAGKKQGLSDQQALKAAGIKQPYRTLAVLRQTRMPAVLIELGFMTNPDDMNKLENATIRRSVCLAIASALLDTNVSSVSVPPIKPSVVRPNPVVPELNLQKIPVPTRKHIEMIVAEKRYHMEDVEKGLDVAEALLEGVAAAKVGDAAGVVRALITALKEYRG